MTYLQEFSSLGHHPWVVQEYFEKEVTLLVISIERSERPSKTDDRCGNRISTRSECLFARHQSNKLLISVNLGSGIILGNKATVKHSHPHISFSVLLLTFQRPAPLCARAVRSSGVHCR